jgi:nucleotide-binding universal stress UspA family protein
MAGQAAGEPAGQSAGQAAAPVVAGIDGSRDAHTDAALDYAAWQACRRRRPLRLVHGFVPARDYGPAIAGAEDVPPGAEDLVRDAAATVHRRYPELDVTTAVTAGSPAGVLTEESRGAALVVVGSPGLGRVVGLLAGSVSSQVATYAHSPVIVVRSSGWVPPGDGGPSGVVVGVDGSAGGSIALGFAFEEAVAYGGDLTAVYAWQELPAGNLDPGNLDPGGRRPSLSDGCAEADRLLSESLAGWQAKYPDLTVRRRAVHSFHAVPTLIDEAHQAGLIVVGARGRGGFRGLRLGSVGDGLLHHARQPVAIVHGDTGDGHGGG